MIGEPLAHTMNNEGQPDALDEVDMPTEFVNFHRMTHTNPITGARWSVLIEYEADDEPRVVGIWRVGDLNPHAIGDAA
jgi:hypothetical protein